MADTTLPTSPRVRSRPSLRAWTLCAITALFLSQLLVLLWLGLGWPATPRVQAASGNAITWQTPLSGPFGTLASITGIAEVFPPGSVFALALRPGQGLTLSDYATICQSTTLPKVAIGQVTEDSQYKFAKTFHWPSAASQLGP